MNKKLEKIKNEIEVAYNNYPCAQNIEELNREVNHFRPMLDEFYDELSIYLINRYEMELNSDIDYRDSVDSFYNRITRFGYNHLYLNRLEKFSSNNSDLDELIYNVRKSIAGKDSEYHTEQKCSIASFNFQKLTKDTKLKSFYITTNEGFGLTVNPHAFNIIYHNDKLYLVDCTYSQFTKLFQMDEKIIKLPIEGSAAEPMFYLLQSDEGKKLANDILTVGYFEITPKNFKLYLDSFLLSNRNAFTYLKYPNLNPYKSEIPEKYYMNKLTSILKKLNEINKYSTAYLSRNYGINSYNIPTIYKIKEYDYEKDPKYLDKEQLKNIDNILLKNK